VKLLIDLFLSFAKIGVLTFGGGLTMLPMLNHELVKKRGWVTDEELLDYYAIGQCTPGIIAVNTATFVGYKKKGVLGGIVATLGMVTPSITIILLVATVLSAFMSNSIVMHALTGIRAVVCALLANTVITFTKKSVIDIFGAVVYIATIALSFLLDVPSVIIVVIAGVLGVFFGKMKSKKEAKVK